MSQPEEKNIVVGVVVEALPNTQFRIQLPKKDENAEEEGPFIAYLSGKMRLHRIRVIVGDRVEVLLDEYGGKGRIIKRF